MLSEKEFCEKMGFPRSYKYFPTEKFGSHLYGWYCGCFVCGMNFADYLKNMSDDCKIGVVLEILRHTVDDTLRHLIPRRILSHHRELDEKEFYSCMGFPLRKKRGCYQVPQKSGIKKMEWYIKYCKDRENFSNFLIEKCQDPKLVEYMCKFWITSFYRHKNDPNAMCNIISWPG